MTVIDFASHRLYKPELKDHVVLYRKSENETWQATSLLTRTGAQVRALILANEYPLIAISKES